VPSAYKSSALGDVVNFVDFYKDDFEVHILVDDISEDVIEKDGYKIANIKTLAGKFARATADYVIDAGTMNFGLRSNFNNNAKWYSVWHGVPYKKMFLDLESEHVANVTAGYASAYDAMISSSSFYTDTFLKGAMGYAGKIYELGCSRVDLLINNNNEEHVNEIKRRLSIPRDKKVILYAPTYRKAGKFRPEIALGKFFRELGDEYYLLIKLHYTNEMAEGYGHPRIKDVTSYDNIGDLYLISDMMITDYSSTMFDYSVLNKPTIFYQYDSDDYHDKRGTYFQLSDYVDERLIVDTQDDLISLIKDKELKKYKNTLRENFMPHEDGQSTERIVRALNLDATPRKHRDIIFLVNSLNEIGGVHTFVNVVAKHYKEKFNARIFVLGLREFSKDNEKIYLIDKGSIDYTLSIEHNRHAITHILKGSEGIVISTQYSAYLRMQRYLAGKNSLFMFHGNAQELIARVEFSNHLNKINNGSVYNYKKIVLLSEGNTDILRPGLSEKIADRLDYVENTCDLPYRGSIDEGYTYSWAYVGRLSDEKNPLMLIDVAKEMKCRGLRYRINVYGDGPLREELQDAILENGLSEIVFLEGYVADKYEIFSKADGLLMLSKNEGFPMVILESYSFGKPVVALDTFSTASELVDDGKTGFLVEFNNAGKVVDSITKAYSLDASDIEAKFMQYAPDRIFKKWDRLFESLKDFDTVEKYFGIKEVDRDRATSLWSNFSNRRLLKKRIRKASKRIKKASRRAARTISPRLAGAYSRQQVSRRYNLLLEEYDNKGVSIVIPYFNNSETVGRTIASVLEQNLSDYEIVVVNDGSTDVETTKLTEIVSGFKKDGICIAQHDKENSGPGLARNFGIERADKDYVFFLDADDKLPHNAINYLLYHALKNNLEVVSGLCERIYLTSGHKEGWYPTLYSKERTFSRGNDRTHMYKDALATNKIYRRDTFAKYSLFFEDGLYEDKLFTAKIYSRVEKFGVIGNVVYSWLVYGRGTSISSSKSLRNFMERMDSAEICWEYYSDYVKLYMLRHILAHDVAVALREFRHYSKSEKIVIYKRLRTFLDGKSESFYPKLYNSYVSSYIYNVLAIGDFDLFEKIGNKISEEFHSKNEKI